MNAERTIYMACDDTEEASECRYCNWRERVAEYLEERKDSPPISNFRINRDLAIIEFKTPAALVEFLLQYGEACLTRETCSELLRLLRVKRKAAAYAEEAAEEEARLEYEKRLRDEEKKAA